MIADIAASRLSGLFVRFSRSLAYGIVSSQCQINVAVHKTPQIVGLSRLQRDGCGAGSGRGRICGITCQRLIEYPSTELDEQKCWPPCLIVIVGYEIQTL